MTSTVLKPAQTRESNNKYRWCEKMDGYISVLACKKRGEIKRSCQRCLFKWDRERLQLQLPITNRSAIEKLGPISYENKFLKMYNIETIY
jgi:hypothetical protein